MRDTIHPIYERRSSLPNHFGYYYKMGIFAQYVTKRRYNRYSDQKWKIHLNYPVHLSEDIKVKYLQTILTFLQTKDLSHKIVIKEEDINYRMNRTDPSNTQNGKIITIYCNSEQECFETMKHLDGLFQYYGYHRYPLLPNQQVRNDKLFNNNPFIGYRYASMPRRPYYVPPTDRYGRPIEDIQEKYSLIHQN